MENPINPRCVVLELLRMVNEELDFDQRDIPNQQETEVARILLMKFAEVTCDYEFMDELQYNPDDGEDGDYIDDDGLPLKKEQNYVSLEDKKKIIQLYDEKVKVGAWKFQTLQHQYPGKLKNHSYINWWRQQIRTGGSRYDKLAFIEYRVLELFKEARSEYRPIHDINLRRWAIEASINFVDFRFSASTGWLSGFKKKNGITSRKIQKLVNKREVFQMDELLKNAESFRQEFKTTAKKFSPSHVFNTDQVGFTYEILPNRTLSWKGERRTWGFSFSPKNRGTHSYTVQPIISLDGQLIGDFYVCLQEKNGRLGPIVKNNIFSGPNLTVTSSASGKLTSSHVEYFLKKVVAPVVKEIFLITFDHCTAQTKPELYNMFGKEGNPECTRLLIPDKCTGYCQPLDTYFNRQLKFLAKKITQEAVLREDLNMSDRNSILTLQSILHFLLKAEIFRPMIRHSWVTSGLLTNNEVFETVHDVCFSFKAPNCETTGCAGKPFLKCSHCRKVICFSCLFDSFHVMVCQESPFLKPQNYPERIAEKPDEHQVGQNVPMCSSTKRKRKPTSKTTKKKRKNIN